MKFPRTIGHYLQGQCLQRKKIPMSSLMVDFITSLDSYGTADDWPGYWGMEGPESSTLQAPLSWANTELVGGDAVEAVQDLKRRDSRPLRTVGSISLCRSLLKAGLVDRLRVVVFPVITGASGRERLFERYPDIALDLVESRTFDGRLQLLEYVPTVLDGPPEWGTQSRPRG